MKLKHQIFVLLIVLLVASCHSTLFVSKKYLLKKAEKYREECVSLIIKSEKDTIPVSDNNKCIIISKDMFAVGSFKKGKHSGIWYFFRKNPYTNNFDCSYILRFEKNGNKILLYSSGFVNEKFY